MQKPQGKYKGRQLREGEFISPTQMPINRVSIDALKVRSTGISILRETITKSVGPTDEAYETVKHLIAAMNFSVQEVNKEIKARGNKNVKK
jgi:hypothetical protein